LKLPTLSSDPAAALSQVGMAVSDYLTPTVRLGVTGLSRSGKTVFITGLVYGLKEGAADPTLINESGMPGFRAYLEPQPDFDVPRFAYEEHLKALLSDPPLWPESTKRISQLRLTLEWEAQDPLRKAFGLTQRLHIDIVDYPGEWLIDLGLLEQTFAQWSREALFTAKSTALNPYAKAFLAFEESVESTAAIDEQVAIKGARLYTDYIRRARVADPSRAALGPGRFLLPGDLEGSPQLTFFPLREGRSTSNGAAASASWQTIGGLLTRRFEKYKQNIVQPFFEKHFSRIDRQIVLVDALSALNGGAEALANLEEGLNGVMKAFRPGTNSWLSMLLGRRIDRILFAATKGDHIHQSSHDRLEAILTKAVSRAAKRASAAGAGFNCIALAALRATEDVDTKAGQHTYHCIRGVPLAGEEIEGRRFDGQKAAVVFPGDLPADPLDAFDTETARPEHYRFVRFRPPVLKPPDGAGGAEVARWPHIGLEKAFAFLFEDRLP
jgi:uncharacterized protein